MDMKSGGFGSVSARALTSNQVSRGERGIHMKDNTYECSTRSGFPLPFTAVVPCATPVLSDQLRSSSIV